MTKQGESAILPSKPREYEMSLSRRQKDILNAVRASGRVAVDDLSNAFEVTPQTIRRDLNTLCDEGHLTRVHGGAILQSGVANTAYEARKSLAADEKEAIGKLCASLIPDDASLFINIGTTTEAVARALKQHRDLLVITNNLNVANIMADNPNCGVMVTGGMLRRSDGGLVGESTLDAVQQFKVDYAIIGVSAIDEDGSLLDFDYREVRVSQAIIKNARNVFLVADSSKLSRTAPARIGQMSEIDAYFTDNPLPDPLAQICQHQGVEVYTLG